MPKPSTSLLITVLAGALSLGGALTATGACSSPDGVTPGCQFNVGGNGVVAQPNGCESFAPCLDGNGNPLPAKACCVDDAHAPLTGNALAICLYGYGEGPQPDGTSSSSAASSASSSSAASSSSGGVADAGDGG